MRFHIVLPGENPAFLDVLTLLQGAFWNLGHPCTSGQSPRTDAMNVLLAYQFLKEVPSGCRYIVYQFEQLPAVALACWTPLARLAARAVAIWDYDKTNVAYMTDRGLRARHVPLGYHEAIDNTSAVEHDIDVLFYGWLNDRRRDVLRQLARSCRVQVLENCYGDSRNRWVDRAKIVLNVHYYGTSNLLEQVRVAPLLASGRCVVSEDSADRPLSDCIYYAPYDQLVSACVALLAENGHAALGKIGRERFKRQRMIDSLHPAVEALS